MVVVPGHAAGGEYGSELVQSAESAEGPLVVVIDRQPLFLAALGSLLAAPPLRARLSYASDTASGLQLVEQAGEMSLVFCEVRAEPISAVELAGRLAQRTPKVPVIVLGESDDERMTTAALDRNIAGLFTKDAALDEFMVGVRAVLAGHRAVGSKLMTHLLSRLEDHSSTARRTQSQLSATELDILSMIGQAKSISAIAESRGISHKTVRNHLANIYRKLELRSRTEAMLFAARMGLTSG
ncbi:MAG TPA: response regulator transcription factor [Candidatus Dormibacteraeota bacterium]|nr:response regulator transcription factor [Candidatus Dormibacteraeota bacterium]